MKLVAIIVAIAATAQSHILVPSGSLHPAVARRTVLVVPPYYDGVPHVKPVTVVFIAPPTPDGPKVDRPIPEKPDSENPHGKKPAEEPAVAAKPAFPAPGDVEDVPIQFPETEPEGANGDGGENEGDLDVDGPLEQPGFQDSDDDDDVGRKPSNGDAPAVSAKPAFNVPENGEGDHEKPSDNGDKSNGGNSTQNAGIIPTDPYIPSVMLPNGYIAYPFLLTPPSLGAPQEGSDAGARRGLTPVDRRYIVSYYIPHVFHRSYAGYGFAPPVIYKPVHAYIK